MCTWYECVEIILTSFLLHEHSVTTLGNAQHSVVYVFCPLSERFIAHSVRPFSDVTIIQTNNIKMEKMWTGCRLRLCQWWTWTASQSQCHGHPHQKKVKLMRGGGVGLHTQSRNASYHNHIIIIISYHVHTLFMCGGLMFKSGFLCSAKHHIHFLVTFYTASRLFGKGVSHYFHYFWMCFDWNWDHWHDMESRETLTQTKRDENKVLELQSSNPPHQVLM